MTAPPGIRPAISNGITGTQTNAETKRQLSARVIKTMRAAGLPPQGWQVRSLVSTLIAAHEEPTDRDVVSELMSAPWYPKPRIRKWQIGEAGWRTHS